VVAALLGNACGGDSSSDSATGPADSEATLSSSSICEDCDESSSSVTPKSSSSFKVPATGEGPSSSSVKLSSSVTSSSSAKSSSNEEIKQSSSSTEDSISSVVEKPSSSSSEAISSSSNAITPVYGDPLIDSRDGRSYKTVVIGSQIWMAEDLKYAPDSGNAAVGKHSWCYEDNDEYCEKYGRLYDWTAAVDTLDSHCGYNHSCDPFDEPRQGICPEGWHIPSQKEAVELRTILSSANNDDDFGFDVQLSGYRNIKGQTGNFDFGKTVIYWTIEQYTDRYARNFIFSSYMVVAFDWDFKFDARSVRCLKD